MDDEGKRHPRRLHRIVAEVFIPNPKGLPCVRHRNGKGWDCREENLAWGTYQENEEDKHLHGTWEDRRVGKLTLLDRVIIRRQSAAGQTPMQIADVSAVCAHTVRRLLNGQIWNSDPEL